MPVKPSELTTSDAFSAIQKIRAGLCPAGASSSYLMKIRKELAVWAAELPEEITRAQMKEQEQREREVTTNKEQSLYVIPAEGGFTCLGFDVCLERIKKYAGDLGLDIDQANIERGSIAAYQYYRSLVKAIADRFNKTGKRCNTDLTPQLIGLEGKRIEVVDCYDEKRRFWVGKSTGWIPIHLEIEKRSDDGGGGVTGTPFKSIRVLEEHR